MAEMVNTAVNFGMSDIGYEKTMIASALHLKKIVRVF
jgi:hypothetical protein